MTDYTSLLAQLDPADKLNDRRGPIAYRVYPGLLDHAVYSRQYADWEHKIYDRAATELERAMLIHAGYVAVDDERPIRVKINFGGGVYQRRFSYLSGEPINQLLSEESES